MSQLKMKYLVLSPDSSDERHAKASRDAIMAYAKSVEAEDPEYAANLRGWVGKVEIERAARSSS